MARATWNGTVIAESESVQTVDGYTYFPPQSIKRELLKPSSHTSVCPWKGTANYFTITVDGKENPDAAWVYQEPKPEAAHIKGHIGFWRGVEIKK
ncbi:MAG TPA: DUF427 domain-containing protein [Candidatus Angelobacter sp.]|jgi:uncharacterized protein (DUF427 family)|nr:DUF427 domain-containing protein [Candidatus Angelobacter sp.]